MNPLGPSAASTGESQRVFSWEARHSQSGTRRDSGRSADHVVTVPSAVSNRRVGLVGTSSGDFHPPVIEAVSVAVPGV